jgi:hypothetical protein
MGKRGVVQPMARDRRAARFVVAGWCALATAAACSTFGDSDDSTSDGDGGLESTTNDGASLVDGGTADGGGDGSIDAAGDVARDVSPGSPCLDAGFWLCDDFDRDAALSSNWPSILIAGDAGLLVDPLSSAPTAPNVLTVRAGSGAEARLANARFVPATAVHCELDMLVVQRTATPVVLFTFELSAANYYYRVELRGAADHITQYGSLDGNNFTSPTVAATLSSAWEHITGEIVVTGGRPHVQVSISEKALATDGIFDAGGPFGGASGQSAAIGIFAFAGSTGDWVVRYDNVVCY